MDADTVQPDISTHALTEGDVQLREAKERELRISTHALTEGDKPELRFLELLVISTHALTEGDPPLLTVFKNMIFQLTPSRRATSRGR